MFKQFFVTLKAKKPRLIPTEPSEEDMRLINGMKQNGPLRELKPDEVICRAMIILGEENTTKLSVHPEGEINGKNVKTLSEIARLLPGAPMIDGHRRDTAAWGRCYMAEVIDQIPGYKGKVLKLKYYWMNGPEGQERMRKVDGGILGEWSIAYGFKKAKCSICHKEMAAFNFFGSAGSIPKCKHQLGTKDPDTGLICYWYPTMISYVAEVSSVFRGAYQKTKSMLGLDYNSNELQAAYSEDEIDGAKELQKQLSINEEMLQEENHEQEENPGTHNDTNGENQQTQGDDRRGNQEGEQNQENDPDQTNTEQQTQENHEEQTQNPKENTRDNEDGNGGSGEPNVSGENAGGEGEDDHGGSEGGGKGGDSGAEESVLKTDEMAAVTYFFENESIGLDQSEVEDALSELLDGDEDKMAAALELDPDRSVDNKGDNETGSAQGNGGDDDGDECEREKRIYCEQCDTCHVVNLAFDGSKCAKCGAEIYIEETPYIFKRVGPVKPAKSGAVNNEYFKLDDFSQLPDGKYHVEGKYDGVWFELHRDGDKVKLYTDEGNEYSGRFPGIVAEAKAQAADKYIIVGEMVKYRGRQRLTHSDVTGYIHEKGEPDDRQFRYKPFDIVLIDGKSLDKLSLEDRRARLDKEIKWGKQIHPTKYKMVNHKKGSGKLEAVIKDRMTREGAMVKGVESTYTKAGRKALYKYKRQNEVNARVAKINDKPRAGFVYTCEVGNKDERVTIGDTFATKIKAAVGDVITVSVDKVVYDEKADKWTWHVPKVIAKTDKSEPDPISTLRKIAVKKGAGDASNCVTLGEVVPLLIRMKRDWPLFLVGSIVEHGITANDIDLVTRIELDAERKGMVRETLGARIGGMVDFVHDADGPAGAYLQIDGAMADQLADGWKYARKFIIQEHGWGKKVHYDIRFGAPKTPRMWGYTLFSKPENVECSKKVRCQEKKYHDPKWMDVNTKKIRPGEPGNPTKNLNAWMIKIDTGDYEYIRRKPGFLEVVLHGKKYNGRWLFREIQVKSSENALYKIDGDEVGVKSEKIWVMWKPKEQEVKKPAKKLAYARNDHGQLYFWETADDDLDLEAMQDEVTDDGSFDYEVM